jgi:hypothetical protein
MTELNGRRFIVANKTTHTFELTSQVTGAGINGTVYTAYTSGGTAARIYEIATPYAIADLPELKYVQSADVMTLTHAGYAIRELSRTGHASWTLSTPSFAPGITHPTGQTVTAGTAGAVTVRYRVTAIAEETFEESLPATNNTTKTITGATAANPVVITATSHGFANGDEVYISGIVGMTELNGRRFIVANKAANTFELEDEDGSGYTAYTSGGTAAQTFVEITNSATTMNNTIAWTAITGAQKYAVYKQDNGLYGLIGETEGASFTDDNIAVDFDISPPRARNPFLDSGDYPGAVAYYEQRRVFGGSTDAPDTSEYSQTGRYSNFSSSSPAQADDAITATLNSQSVNEIRHYVPGNDLIILTAGAEWRVTSGADASFEAATIRQKPQSQWGSSHLRPIVSGSAILFVDDSKTTVRSLGYSLQIDGYTGSNLSLLAAHLTEDYIMSGWAYARTPVPLVAGVREDGKIILFTFMPEQDVIAWAHWDTLGKFESIAALRSPGDAEGDKFYFVVQRTVGGETVRYIEYQHTRRFTDVRDCFFVDCGLSLDSPVTISGATAANPVVVTATSHGFEDGDEIDINGIEWTPDFDDLDNETQPDQLNGRRYTVTNKTTHTFELLDSNGDPVDGSAFNDYVSGGEARLTVSEVTGLWHLEGRDDLIALSDGNAISGLTVTNGAVTLPRNASRVHIGLKFIADIETLNIDIPGRTIQGKLKNISSVVLRVKKTRGGFIGPAADNMTEAKWREFEDYGDPTELLTGDKEVSIPPDWNSQGRIFIRQRYPLPLTLLAAIPDLTVAK